MRTFIILLLIITLVGPAWLLLSGQVNLSGSWRTANRASAHLAPSPATEKQALVQIYAAKAYGWRGIFAVHTWIATKEKSADAYIIYQVIGWQYLFGLPALSIKKDLPDRYWFGHKPYIIAEIKGATAQTIIQKIKAVTENYPYKKYYVLWPGPNSNTFVSYVVRHVPELNVSLPSNAVGKDFVPITEFISQTPSHSGYQLSIYGVLGILIAKEEGLEINLFGLVYGIDPKHRAIKLPGIGAIKLF